MTGMVGDKFLISLLLLLENSTSRYNFDLANYITCAIYMTWSPEANTILNIAHQILPPATDFVYALTISDLQGYIKLINFQAEKAPVLFQVHIQMIEYPRDKCAWIYRCSREHLLLS